MSKRKNWPVAAMMSRKNISILVSPHLLNQTATADLKQMVEGLERTAIYISVYFDVLDSQNISNDFSWHSWCNKPWVNKNQASTLFPEYKVTYSSSSSSGVGPQWAQIVTPGDMFLSTSV